MSVNLEAFGCGDATTLNPVEELVTLLRAAGDEFERTMRIDDMSCRRLLRHAYAVLPGR